MATTKYFPLGIAKKGAFCNRERERAQIKQNVADCRHTIIISPRRYGKSSLVLYTLEEMHLPYERVDLFVAIDAKTVENQILHGVQSLINKVSSPQQQTIDIIKSYFKQLKLKWVIGSSGINIELIPGKENDAISNIKESLQILEHLLTKKKQKAILFIDEFQEVGVLTNNKGIEGAIRHVAQESEFLSFVFSGSNRHILSSMFDDRSSPLYMLCERINLSRIEAAHYVKYIQTVSRLTWNKEIKESVITEILSLTDCHPYYVNALCHRVWTQHKDKPPLIPSVKENWSEYVLQEESKIAQELTALSTSQKKLLVTIAQGITDDLSGKSMLAALNLSSATVFKGLKSLEAKDYIHKNKTGQYQILDPLIKASLQMFYMQNEVY